MGLLCAVVDSVPRMIQMRHCRWCYSLHCALVTLPWVLLQSFCRAQSQQSFPSNATASYSIASLPYLVPLVWVVTQRTTVLRTDPQARRCSAPSLPGRVCQLRCTPLLTQQEGRVRVSRQIHTDVNKLIRKSHLNK